MQRIPSGNRAPEALIALRLPRPAGSRQHGLGRTDTVRVRVDGQAPFQLGAGELRRLRVAHGTHNVVVDGRPAWTIELPDGLHTNGVPTMAEQCFVELDVTFSHYGKGKQGPPPSVTGRFRQKGPYELPTTYSLSEAELPDHVTEKVRNGRIVGMSLVLLSQRAVRDGCPVSAALDRGRRRSVWVDSPLLPGQHNGCMGTGAPVNEYELGELVYESSRTRVWRARFGATGERVVLKVLRPEAASEGELARFRHEFDVTSRADVPGVIAALGLEERHDSLLMVLEDIGGESLDRIIARGPLSLSRILELASALADTVARLHERRIIHKHITPANIVYNASSGQHRLIDFGIADDVRQREIAPRPPAALEGTLPYLSPEQTGRMNRALDYRTDFYSLGVTFYELLTGRVPFQATDPLALVHSHIAVPPTSPRDVDRRIPETVSRIVLKLLSKTAEDRYQSGWGLKADLLRCLRGLRENGAVPDFVPGQDDFADRLQAPRQLYGREAELLHLNEALERAAAGACELLFVAGHAGVGKTALVRELHRPVVAKRGVIIEGKFDQLQRDVPYFGWLRALEQFVAFVLMEREPELSEWKRRLQRALGANGRVLTDVIRNLELVVGPQPQLPELRGTEAGNRFNYVFVELVKAIAASQNPLVIFLDDLQWIDPASLALLRALVTGGGMSSTLLIGAYRESEADVLHPLTKMIEELRGDKGNVAFVTLAPLSEDAVTRVLADVLREDASEITALARLVYSKTGGNPLFVMQILDELVERRAIAFDLDRRRWTWDESALASVETVDNVVDLLVERLEKLAPRARRFLSFAACMGFRFDLPHVSVVARETEEEAREDLDPALLEGLVRPSDTAYQFVHDRVQQAAYLLIPDAEKKWTHLEIGRLLRRSSPEGEEQVAEEQIFTIVDHLNAGVELMESTGEKRELARLNLRAGRKAKACAAFAAASRYFESGVAVLDDRSWESDYPLALELHSLAAEASALVGDFARTEALFSLVNRRARTATDSVAVYLSRMNALTAQGRLQDTLDCALESLDQLGVHLIRQPSQEDVQRALAEFVTRYVPERIASLADLPEMTDPEMRAAMRILDVATGPAYAGRPALHALLAFELAKLSIRHGASPESMYAFTNIALRLCGLPGGDIERGYQFGELAMTLATRASTPALVPRVLATTVGMVWYYKRHFRDTLDELLRIYPRAKEVGDFEYAGYCIGFYAANAFAAGKNLAELDRDIARYMEDLRQIRAELSVRWTSAFWQAAQNLLGRSERPWVLDGAAYPRQAMLRKVVETGNQAAESALHVNTLMLGYLFQRYEDALVASTATEACRAGLVGLPTEPLWQFYDSLARLALIPGMSQPERALHLERVAANQAYLDSRAQHAPMSFRHKWHLVEAERAVVTGDQLSAIEHFGLAGRLAHEHGFVHEEALAEERAAQFWEHRGRAEYSLFHLERAHRAYQQWGAWAKVSALEATHHELAPRMPAPEHETGALDLATIMRAARTISGEMELDELLGAVMRIVIENAGAQRGVLLLQRDGKWQVAARGQIGGSGAERPWQSVDASGGGLVSLSVVRFVARTREPVVADDACNEARFRADVHIQGRRTRSLLCAPLMSRGGLVGIVYLENDMAAGAFTADRIRLVEMLLSQAATSLENARVYTELRESEAKYRRIVDTASEGVWALSADMTTTFANSRTAEMLGYSVPEMLGRRIEDFLFPEDVPGQLTMMKTRRRGVSETYERRLRRKEGQSLWAQISATPVLDDAGQYQGSFAMLADITERKRAEESLQRLNHELRAITRCHEVLMRADDEETMLRDICRLVCEEGGYRLAWVGLVENGDPLAFRSVAFAGASADVERVRLLSPDGPAAAAVRSGRMVLVREFPPADGGDGAASGSRRELSSGAALPVADESGNVFGVLSVVSSSVDVMGPEDTRLLDGLARDLAFGIGVLRARSKRKQAERSVAVLTFALDNVREAAFLVDEGARFRYVNEEACRILRYSREEMLSMRVADVDPDFPLARWSEHWSRLREQGSLTFEGRHQARDGQVYPVEINANYFEYDGQGYNLALVRDVTERKQAERERERLLEDVQNERNRLGAVVETAPVGIGLYLAPDGRPALLNRAAKEILGRSAGASGLSVSDRAAHHYLHLPSGERVSPEQLPLTLSLRGETLSGIELVVRQPSGREVSILENSAPIRDAEGHIVGAVLAFQDISPIREQERLRHEFLAAAAHELKTPVTTIGGFASLLSRWLTSPRELHAVETIISQTRRIDRRVQEMLEAVRSRHAPVVLLRSVFDLGELALQVVERKQPAHPDHRVSVRREGSVTVIADREGLEEVMTNLLDNAIELSPGGGEIEIRVWSERGEALVSVRDHGVGIPRQRQPHLFEPFYQALPPGAAGYRNVVGLSPYLIRLTIERHRGRVWVESEEGKGSTFYFALPLAPARSDRVTAPDLPAP